MKNGIEGITKAGEVEVGKIKAGRTNDQNRPEKLDHFIVTTTEKKDGNFILDPVMDKLPDKPEQLGISLFHDEVDKNFLNYFAYYKGYNDLLCRGNGKKAIWHGNEEPKEIKCDPRDCKHYQNNNCSPNGILKVSLDKKPGVGGAYFYRTTSWFSVKRIKSNLQYIKEKAGGILAGLSLKLVLRQERNSDNHKIYVAHIEYPGTVADLKEEALKLARVRDELDIRTNPSRDKDTAQEIVNIEHKKSNPTEPEDNPAAEQSIEETSGAGPEEPEDKPTTKQDIIDEIIKNAGDNYNMGQVKQKAFERCSTGELDELDYEELQFLWLEFVQEE